MKRRDFLRGTTALAASGAVAGAAAPSKRAWAQGQKNTLVTISEGGANGLDVHAPGANRGVFQVSWNLYDRLISFGIKTDANGNQSWDSTKFAPELAEEWDLRDMSVTFKLRRSAMFHDGTPVTAKDVKWSYDRAVSIPGFPKSSMGAGSLTRPEQFVAVDDHTFRIDFDRRDKLSMPTAGLPVGVIINSELAKKHATANDPWAVEWVKNNPAGGGAYTFVSRQGDQEMVFARNEKWTCGPMPQIERVVWRTVPSASTRRALIERGDADFSNDMPPKDAAEMAEDKRLRIVGTPMDNSVQYIAMQVTMPRFDNLKVRQAIAYAIPYQKIMEAAIYRRGRPLFGGADRVTSPVWPQPHHYVTDLAKSKQLLAEAGFPNGFETTLSLDLGAAVTNEPICVLVQENLREIGIKVTLNKIANSNWRSAFLSKKLPLLTNVYGGWFNYPDYFFYWVYHGKGMFNSSNYQSAEMDKLVDTARFEPDPHKYTEEVESFIRLGYTDLPSIPLYQPFHDVAMQQRVTGYKFWFHRQLDYRPLQKA